MKGFYFWRDNSFSDLATATTDANRDTDGNDADNSGFVLVVDQAFFNGLSANGGLKNVGSSSDRVDSALNSVLPTNTAPVANLDTATAVESGGVSNATAGTNPTGNVLTNDTDANAGDTKTLQKIGTGSASTDVTTGTTSANGTQVSGSYGTLKIGADGSYVYTVDNSLLTVQKLRQSTDTLTDTFTYKMADGAGASSTSTLTVTIQGRNDAPVAVADYNTAKETITSPSSVTGYNATGNVLTNDTDVDGYGDSKSLAGGSLTIASYTTVAPSSTLTFRGANSLNSVGSGDEAWLLINGTYNALLDASGGQIYVTSITNLGGTDWDIKLSATPTAYYKSGGNVSISGVSFLSNKTVGFVNINNPPGTTSNSGSIKDATVSASTKSGGSTLTLASSTVDLQVGMTITGTGIPADTVITGVTTTGGVTTITLDKVISSAQNATVSASAAGTYVGNHGVLTLSANGDYTYTPTSDNAFLNGGQSAVETFTYSMKDAAGLTSQSTLNITVYGTSTTEPIARADLANGTPATNGGAALEAGAGVVTVDATGNVMSNDTPNGTARVVGAKLGPSGSDQTVSSGTTSANGTQIVGAYGTLTIGADGTYRYAVNNSHATVQALNTTDSLSEVFSYTIQNGNTAPNTSTAYLTVQINGSNDAPVATDDSALAQETGGLSNATVGLDPTGNVLGNDSDVDGIRADLVITAIRTGVEGGSGTGGTVGTALAGQYGTLTLRADGSWSYQVNNSNSAVEQLGAGQSLSDNFTYTVKDTAGTGASDTGTLTVTIQGAADIVTVSDVFVNEASPYAVFAITGGVGQSVELSLGNSTGLATNDAKATLGTDLSNTLQYLNGSTWQNYDPAHPPAIPAGGTLLVRTAITPDTLAEGNEAFTLDVRTTDGSITRGIGTIGDEGDGNIFLAGNTTATANTNSDAGYPTQLDDDRRITIANISVNETGGQAVFNVTGASGQLVRLALANGTALGGADFTASLEYLNGATWQAYTANSSIAIPANGVLQVRAAIIDDASPEGNETFTLTATNTGGTDTVATATILDNETASITITGGPITTTEAGATGQFSVVLASQPNADVTVTISGLDATEGTLSVTTLTFTTLNWNVPQSVTVTGADDTIIDGNQTYTLTGTANGGGYNGQTATVSVTNTDNDTAGLTVTGGPLTTTEAGQNASFTVKLSSQPTSDVTITVSSGNTGEGTVGPTTLTFTASNWNTPQTVNVTHVDDFINDGDVSYSVSLSAASSDATYQGKTGTVSVTNIDNDTASSISIADVTISESGGSATITFTRSGATGGAASVAWTTSNGTAIGGSDFTSGSGTVNFLAGETTKTISIPIINDAIAEGTETFSVTLSSATGATIGTGTATVTINDNDAAGLIISSTTLTTTEAGQDASFTVKLSSQPTSDVTITVSSGNTGEGTVGPTTLTFTASNWNTPQTVNVTHVDDFINDGDVSYSVSLSAASSDATYQGKTGTVSVTNIDNDTASSISIADVTISESGGSATITFTRSGATGGAASVAWTTSNGTAIGGSDFTSGSGTVNFLAGETTKTISIPIINDAIAEGTETFSVTLSSATGATIGTGTATVTINDNDTAGLTITGGPLTTTEGGTTAQFTLVLTSQPTADVTVVITGLDATEGTLSTTSLTFTALNWNQPQTVTVTGVDDALFDGNQTYTLTATANGGGYVNKTGTIIVTNQDNEMPVPPVITNVTETPTDPTPNDLLTGDVTQVLTVTGTPGFSLKLYTLAGQLIPTSGYTVTETTPGVFQVDAQGINLAAGQYVVRQSDSFGHESTNSNSFTIDTTPELEEKISARSVQGGNILTGQFEVIDQNRVNLSPFQGAPPITRWYDADGEQAVFGLQGGVVTGNIVTATLINGASLQVNRMTGAYTYRPDSTSTLDSFGVTVRDPGGKGGNLALNFETRDLLDRDGVPGNSEDRLATRLTGIADNNGDGIADSTQNAVTTMAWTKRGYFDNAVQGQVDAIPTNAVITVVANQSAAGTQVSSIAQLINFNVLSVNRDGSGGLPLNTIPNVFTPWDALAFSIEPLQSLGLIDIDANRPGLQQRITIDISKAGVREGEFQAYYKWISADTIAAAQNAGVALVTLDGVALTAANQAGWYDFTSRVAGGDGARYIVNQGMITGIELILTDNAFGDIDFTVGRITDPGMPVALNKTNPTNGAGDTQPPVITGPSGTPGAAATTKAIYENTTPVFTFTANENVTWSIAGGNDSGFFRLDSNGALFFRNAPDYEAPLDAGRNNVYELTIRAVDVAGNAAQQAVSVSVLDVAEGSTPVTSTPIQPPSGTLAVYKIDLRSGDRMLSLDGGFANAVAQSEGSVTGVQFWVRPDAAPGFIPLIAWQNLLTGDLYYAPQGTALPYACYVETGSLGYVARPGQGSFDLHLWIGYDGITQIVNSSEAQQLGLVGKGFTDLGALFASA